MYERHVDLAREAAEHDGILTREILHRLGHGDRGIQRRVAAGVLTEVHPGVYRLAGQPETLRSKARAAFLWGGEGAVLTGATALKLRGLDGIDDPGMDIYVVTNKRAPGVLARRSADAPTIRRPLNGMWTTTIERALLDACSTQPPTAVGKAMDDALRKRLTTVERLQKEVAQAGGKGKKGLTTFRKLVAMRDPMDEKVRSEMETRMLRILRKIRSHELKPNFLVVARGNRYYLDFAFPQVQLGIECQSRRWHATERVSADSARHTDLTLQGWTVLYFTWDDIIFRSTQVLRDIEAALSSTLAL